MGAVLISAERRTEIINALVVFCVYENASKTLLDFRVCKGPSSFLQLFPHYCNWHDRFTAVFGDIFSLIGKPS